MAVTETGAGAATDAGAWLRAGDLARLRAEGQAVFSGADRPVGVFYRDGTVCALDNRCPHMGFGWSPPCRRGRRHEAGNRGGAAGERTP